MTGPPAIVPNWDVAIRHEKYADWAARAVSNRYKDRAVASLAEYDDMYQEACILLATTYANRADELAEQKLLTLFLIRKMNDRVRYRASIAQGQVELRVETDEGGEGVYE